MTSQDEHLHDTPASMARQKLDVLRHLLKSTDTPGGTPETLEPQQLSAPPSESTESHPEFTYHGASNFEAEVKELLHFVNKFEFGSPLAKPQRQPRPSPDPPQSVRSVQQQCSSNGCTPIRGPDPLAKTPKTAPIGHRLPFTERTNQSFLHEMEATKANLHTAILSEGKQGDQHEKVTLRSPLGDPEGLLLVANANDGAESILSLSVPVPAGETEEDYEDKVIPVMSDNDWGKFNHLLRHVDQALKEAKAEKEAARRWAKEVRETTESWVEAQQRMIELEKSNTSNCGTNTQSQEQYSQNQLGNKQMDQYEARIEGLESSIRELEVELKTTELHHQTNEKRLLGIIQYQQEHLRKLHETRGVMSEEGSHRINTRSTPFPVRNLNGRHQEQVYAQRGSSFEAKHNLDEFATTIQKELYFSDDKSTKGRRQGGSVSSVNGVPVSTATQTSPWLHQSSSRRYQGRRYVALPTGAEFLLKRIAQFLVQIDLSDRCRVK